MSKFQGLLYSHCQMTQIGLYINSVVRFKKIYFDLSVTFNLESLIVCRKCCQLQMTPVGPLYQFFLELWSKNILLFFFNFLWTLPLMCSHQNLISWRMIEETSMMKLSLKSIQKLSELSFSSSFCAVCCLQWNQFPFSQVGIEREE